MLNLAGFVTTIIDYKSAFTQRHSRQIANKAWLMARYYKCDQLECSKLFLAAALHDLGKLYIPSSILEKPGKLDEAEYAVIKSHVTYTCDLLAHIEGFEDVHRWAGFHHEKLDGSGYPFGKRGAELDFNARLLACIDIYQALSEERPYHARRNHEDTMCILYDMAHKGHIDKDIAADIDTALAAYSLLDVGSPLENVVPTDLAERV